MIGNWLLLLGLAATSSFGLPTNDTLGMSALLPDPGVVITKCSSPGMIALAYDDGPYSYTSQLVNTLDASGAKATFFFTGTLYGCIYNRAADVKKAYSSGHQIASHTW